ncbi:MAG: hypothetical protein BZY81_07815 [SAR202 cluster bacterium Io17-Chloro-G4]|nr:MAG: hypothetical protein BZY81_07815 [SAR202 cluster bacterium Io17-Chloro-G4]
MTWAPVTVTINVVNDTPVVTLSTLNDIKVNEDAPAAFIDVSSAFDDVDIATNADSLTYEVDSNDNPSLVTAFMSGSILNLQFLPEQNGSADITVMAADDAGAFALDTFIVTVDPVNDPPSFSTGLSQVGSLEDAGLQTVLWATSISAGPPNETGQVLTFNVDHTNSPLFSVPPAISSGGILTFTPAQDANGSSTVTVDLSDDSGGSDTSGEQPFIITVFAVNDPPVFTPGANQTIIEGSGTQTITNWATNIDPGPANESGQTIDFVVTDNTAPSLFSIAPAVASNGTLTYSPSSNVNGSATITLHAHDDGGTLNSGENRGVDQTFTITVSDPFRNGSFEIGLSPWTFVNIDRFRDPSWIASEGFWLIDLNGSVPGSISQSFETVSGSQYTVLFDLAANRGLPQTGDAIVNLDVSAAGTTQPYSFDGAGKTNVSLGWLEQSFAFTASGTTTTLTFTSTTTDDSANGPLLDNVRVNAIP